MLTPVDPRYLARDWPYVRDGLQKIAAKTSDDWLPEDIYTDLRASPQTTGLYMLEYAGERIGFVVLQLIPQYHAGPRLFVRAIWTEPGRAKAHRADIYDDLNEFARERGCVAIRMLSPRRWDGDGWTMRQYVFEREVV